MNVDRMVIAVVVLLGAGALGWQVLEFDRRTGTRCGHTSFTNARLIDIGAAINRCARNRIQVRVIGHAAEIRFSAHLKLDEIESFIQLLAVDRTFRIHQEGDVVTVRQVEREIGERGS